MHKTGHRGAADDMTLIMRIRGYLMNHRALIAWAAAACLWSWHGRVHEIDPLHQRHDLEILMTGARSSVKNYIKEQKTLPEQLPDRTLAGFIKYTPLDANAQPPTYSLEGSLMSVTEYWSNANSGGGK